MPTPQSQEPNRSVAAPPEGHAERRASPRYDAPSYVRIVDPTSGRLLGELLDISLDGLRMQAAAAVDLGGGEERPLRLELCLDGSPRDPVDVVAALRWTRADLSPGLTQAGFEFVYLSMEAVNQLDAFVQEMSA